MLWRDNRNLTCATHEKVCLHTPGYHNNRHPALQETCLARCVSAAGNCGACLMQMGAPYFGRARTTRMVRKKTWCIWPQMSPACSMTDRKKPPSPPSVTLRPARGEGRVRKHHLLDQNENKQHEWLLPQQVNSSWSTISKEQKTHPNISNRTTTSWRTSAPCCSFINQS